MLIIVSWFWRAYDVDWVSPATTSVFELPNFDGAALWCSEYTLSNIMPANTVDLPFATLSLEFEVAGRDSIIWWEWNLGRAVQLEPSLTTLERYSKLRI
jgi:hypothetical protein